MTKVNIIGAGLAGSEAAWQLAKRGIEVEIFEMRDDERKTFAHRTKDFAELVCSNSLRSDDVETAIGLLHQEMRLLDSLIMKSADENKIPAGSALAVDREGFSKFIENALLQTGKVKITRKEISQLPENSDEHWLITTGPLTSDLLSKSILEKSGEEHLAFFDAIAPIVFKDSIDMSKAWFQSRYDKGNGTDYINCPLNKEQYEEFVNDLLLAEKSEFKDWEILEKQKNLSIRYEPSLENQLNGQPKGYSLLIQKDTPYFDGCLPIEVMASRGAETLRFGPMKPVGLTNPHFEKSPEKTALKDRKEKAFAVVQLRQDNKTGTLYNIVGFQTKLKYGDQQRIFKKIPGLENAEFARFGGIHRNTFLNSPKLLDEVLRFKKMPHIRFAGQVTGVEGYVESAAMGLLCGIFLAHDIAKKEISRPSAKTAIGALLNHITLGHVGIDFQPMNINFGLFEELEEKVKKADRKAAYSNRALEEIVEWKEKSWSNLPSSGV